MRQQKTFTQPSLTAREFRDECDINKIVDKYKKTGIIEHVREFQGSYVSLPGEVDFHAAVQAVVDAQDAFASLTASVRDRFDNDPAEFLQFVHDENNEDEMRNLGLIRPNYPPAEPELAETENHPETPVDGGENA